LLGNPRGDDAREHRADDDEKSQAERDQHHPPHPV
jgi:hypothetical protein